MTLRDKTYLGSGCLMILIMSLLLATPAAADDAKHADDTTVYHAEGARRVHVEGCRRLTSTKEMTKMTLAEARAKGLPLCSRCPGTTTPRKANPADSDTDTQKPATAPTQAPILLWPADPERNAMDKLGNAEEGDDGKTRVTNIQTPHLIPYLVKDADGPRPAVILCPGGGYKKLVPSLHWPIAQWLNEQGVHAFILMYRCPAKRNGEALPDLQRAIRMVRDQADEWQVDPKRLGVLGTSAGGNLCVRASIGFGKDSYKPVDEADQQSARPDFTVLLYPAYLTEGKTKQAADWVTIPEDMPPTLIFTAKDDSGHYRNSPAYEAALKQANAPVQAYYYKTGGHGFGLSHRASTTPWPERWQTWLKTQGVLNTASGE